MKLNLSNATQDQIEEWNERAAIMEFDGKLDRKLAELLAWRCLERKYQDKPLEKVNK